MRLEPSISSLAKRSLAIVAVYINNGYVNANNINNNTLDCNREGGGESVSHKPLIDRTNRDSLCSRFIDGSSTNGVVAIALFCARCGATARSKASFRFHTVDFDRRNDR